MLSPGSRHRCSRAAVQSSTRPRDLGRLARTFVGRSRYGTARDARPPSPVDNAADRSRIGQRAVSTVRSSTNSSEIPLSSFDPVNSRDFGQHGRRHGTCAKAVSAPSRRGGPRPTAIGPAAGRRWLRGQRQDHGQERHHHGHLDQRETAASRRARGTGIRLITFPLPGSKTHDVNFTC